MTHVDFDPLLPIWAIALLVLAALVATWWLGGRGRALRSLAALIVAIALINPILVREAREPLPDIAVLVIDDSESIGVGDRRAAVAAVADGLRAQADADPLLELVEVTAVSDGDGTALYDAIARATGEAPRDRLAGVVAITDGQAHDLPRDFSALGLEAPVHAAIVGDRGRSDRRIVIRQAPVYAIVNENTRFTVAVDDPNAPPGARARVSLSLDGAEPISATVNVGEDLDIQVRIDKRGPNVVQIEVEPGEDELTLVNNRAAINVNGVRDRLRVLLITGQPHNGARAWRDLLKSDPSVDLVHFTILRPPDKMHLDTAGRGELALIAFPHQELFMERLKDFDLVIFDHYRYYQGEVLRPNYFTEMIRYVEEEGRAMLIAAGPPFASGSSLYRTPLSVILPARPTRNIVEGGYRPQVSDTGRAHPVTSDFASDGGAAERWGRWFRRIDANVTGGQILLEDNAGEPLLVLDRVKEGRVALLLSDQAWLWRRGVDGGGPHAELFRRLAHWLMKEPELEEERLRADILNGVLMLERRTTGDPPAPIEVISPSGEESRVPVEQIEPGLFVGQTPISETGLYAARSGDLNTVAASGPLNPVEFADLRATDEVLAPLLRATSGGASFVGVGEEARAPELRRVDEDARQLSGSTWLGLPRRNVSVATSQTSTPLAPAVLVVLLALGVLAAAWFREGR